MTEHAFDSDPTSIDLFAGAGGFSVALERAGFRTVAAVDIDRDAAATLRRNQSRALPIDGWIDRTFLDGTNIIETDIHDLRGVDLAPVDAPKGWRPDVLAGGPPCQPFSSAGRQKGLRDPRGELFRQFVRIADELQPTYVLFENVRGLLTQKGRNGRPGGVLRAVQRDFEEIGYAVRFAVLNAADYGAPQRRVRLYMIGTRTHELVDFPAPTHDRRPGTGDIKPWVTLGELLGAMPAPDPEDIVLPTGKHREELLKLPPGKGIRTGGVVEYQRPSGHWGYKQDCFRADLALPSRTIRAAATPDWVRVNDGPLRRLTWRECAELQGFPRSWEFEGKRTTRFKLIGNAVCTHIGESIAHQLMGGVCQGPSDRPPVSAPWPETFKKRIDYTAMEARVNGPSRRAGKKKKAI